MSPGAACFGRDFAANWLSLNYIVAPSAPAQTTRFSASQSSILWADVFLLPPELCQLTGKP